MNRDIKFRAWDGILLFEPIVHVEDIGLNAWFREVSPPNGPWVLMQFTGLRDKNGKEIYEGDILSSHSYGNCKVIWPEKYITSDNEDILAWCIEPLDLMKYGGIHGLDVQYTWEIIGNIYENPELISL